MRLVVDANIAFSLFKKGSFTLNLTREHKLDLLSHPFILDELNEHSLEFCSKLKISHDKFPKIRSILSRIVDLSHSISPQQKNRARSLISDPDDTPYLALAIKLAADIWSNDPHLKEQSVVKVFTTEELDLFLKSP